MGCETGSPSPPDRFRAGSIHLPRETLLYPGSGCPENPSPQPSPPGKGARAAAPSKARGVLQRSPRGAGEDSGSRLWQAQVHATSAAHASERLGGWWCGYHAAGLEITPWARRVVAAQALADMGARAAVADLRLKSPSDSRSADTGLGTVAGAIRVSPGVLRGAGLRGGPTQHGQFIRPTCLPPVPWA